MSWRGLVDDEDEIVGLGKVVAHGHNFLGSRHLEHQLSRVVWMDWSNPVRI